MASLKSSSGPPFQFSDPNSGFGIPAPSTAGGVAYAEGALRFSVSKLDAEFFSTSGRVKTQFVKIDVDVQQQAGSALGEYGAICRWQDAKNYTAFAISGAGQYKIWQKTDGATLPLIDWTDAPSLAGAGNASHHLTVACAGTHLSLAVDSVPLGQAEDPAPVPGEIALFAGLREKGKLVVEFRRVTAARP